MGLVYLPTFTIKKSTIHVGKYTSPMDGMGNVSILLCVVSWKFSIIKSVAQHTESMTRGDDKKRRNDNLIFLGKL